jgi:cholesterol transport system auxiliary component
MNSGSSRAKSSPTRSPSWLLCAVTALATAGCALTSKSEPLAPRYFSPERSGEVKRPSARPLASIAELRLGRINGASHLDERLVYRDSDYELGYYAERRWTEAPEEYLARRLTRALFEERGLRHVIGGTAPTLEAELIAFEEVRSPKRVARVQVAVRLLDHRLVRWEETLTIDQPVAQGRHGDLADATVAALGMALTALVDRIADRVTSDLAAPPATSPVPGATAGTSLSPRP